MQGLEFNLKKRLRTLYDALQTETIVKIFWQNLPTVGETFEMTSETDGLLSSGGSERAFFGKNSSTNKAEAEEGFFLFVGNKRFLKSWCFIFEPWKKANI